MEGERQIFSLLGSCADATWRIISCQVVVCAQMRNRALRLFHPGVEVQIFHVIWHLLLHITAPRPFARSAYLKRHEQVGHLQCFSTVVQTLFLKGCIKPFPCVMCKCSLVQHFFVGRTSPPS